MYKSVNDIDWERWEPQQRATLMFVVRDGQILLIHKKLGLGAGKINGPGGRIEPGEEPVDAATREVQEELIVTPSDIVKSGESLSGEPSGGSAASVDCRHGTRTCASAVDEKEGVSPEPTRRRLDDGKDRGGSD